MESPPFSPRSARNIRRAVLTFACVAPLLTVALFRTNWLLALSILFVSHLLLLYATLLPRSQWWGPVFTRFETTAREVWLTIDDGPCEAHTPRILDVLERHGATATFFVIGRRAAASADLVREIKRRGHSVANHTLSHPSATFWCMPPWAVARQIDRCIRTPYFRAPAGLKNCFVHPILARRNMRLIGWSARGFDTVSRDVDAVVRRVAGNVRPGAIILLHECHHLDVDPEFHVRCVDGVVRALKERGYRFIVPRPEQLRC